jgi:hypothetical protein
MKFETDIDLGEKYLDPQTGIQGTATSIHFYQYACERVTLEVVLHKGEPSCSPWPPTATTSPSARRPSSRTRSTSRSASPPTTRGCCSAAG